MLNNLYINNIKANIPHIIKLKSLRLAVDVHCTLASEVNIITKHIFYYAIEVPLESDAFVCTYQLRPSSSQVNGYPSKITMY